MPKRSWSTAQGTADIPGASGASAEQELQREDMATQDSVYRESLVLLGLGVMVSYLLEVCSD